MKKVLQISSILLILVLFGAVQGWGQQVIGSFPYMDGGFENQSTGALGSTLSTTAWSRQSQSGASSSIVTTSPRSGAKYGTVTSVATASRNLQSPQSSTASDGPTANTSYVVQFYVKNASSVNGFQGGVTINGTTNPSYSTAATLSANANWTKQTYILTTQNQVLNSCGIGIAGRAQLGTFDVDDFVIYSGSAVDNTAPNSPGTVTVGNPTTSSLDVSWVAATGGVDGGGYVVVRFASDPGTGNDPNQNGIYAVGNTVPTGGTVRYIGTGISFTDNVDLEAGTQYWYKVYTVDKAFNYSDETKHNGTTSALTSPTITVDPSSLTGFNYWVGSGPSTEQSFTISGINLTADISITPITNYEISTGTGVNFVATSPIDLTQSGGTVANTLIYVRLKAGLSKGTYNGETITATSTGADNKTVTCSGSVSGPVSLPYSENFTDCGATEWTAVSVASNRNWTCGSGYESINAFGGDMASDDYLISPVFDLDATSNENLTFTSWTQYSDVTHPPISLLYTTNYTGNPSTTTWLPLSANWPAQNSQAWTGSGDVNISGISGTMVRFAFRYISSGTGSNTTTAWRVDDISVSEVPPATEPTNHPTGFGASANTSTQITVSWTDALPGSQAPSGYLVMANKTGTFTNPVDGTAQADDTDMSDDAGVKNVAHGTDGFYQWQGLDPGTTYYFKIFSYNGTGQSINYKVDGNEPTAFTQTLASQNTDSEVYAPVTQITDKNISSLADTQGEAVDVFILTIEDQGSGDGFATKVTNIKLIPHTTNTADWTDAIQGVFVDDGTDFIYPTATITDTYIDLTFGASDLNVSDGQTVEVTVFIYLKTSNIVDGAILSFMVDSDNHGFTTDPSGSSFSTSFLLGDFNSANFTFDVDATKLRFIQQPSNVLVDVVMSPAVTVAYADANNNNDRDYNGTGYEITLSTTGTFSGSATAEVAPVNGVATFNNIKFSAPGTGITITATDENSWIINTSVQSNSFNVTTGPTVLSAGDIAFVGYGLDAPDRFAFITFVNINENTQITFTDNGWKSDNTWRTGENTGIWTAPSGGILAGSIIQIEGTTVTGGGTMSAGLSGLSADGDQVIAYQGLSSAPTFITAMNADYSVWQADATSANNSAIPSGLTNNVNANAVSLENGFYSGPTSGTINFLKSSINNPTNWTTTNTGPQIWPSWSFSFGSSTTLSQTVTLFNLLIGSGETLTINPSGQLNVTGTLTNNASYSALVIKSDATGTGALKHNTPNVPATVERYLPGQTGNDNGWHMISSPNENQLIAGAFTDPTPANYDFFAWNEPNSTWLNQKNGANSITNFVPGKGYLVSYLNNSTRNFTGELNAGDYSPVISFTTDRGNNLIGNAYPCPLTGNITAWTKTNVENWIYVYEETSGNYLTWNGTTGDLPGGIIPAMQGFFVKANGAAPTLTVPAASRTTGNTNVYKDGLMDALLMRVTASNGQKNGAVVWFNHEASAGIDNSDVPRLTGLSATAPALYTKIGDDNYSINTLPYDEQARIVPLFFSAGMDGSYTLSASQFETFDAGSVINLEDTRTGQVQNLMLNPDYQFTASKGDDPARFKLHFAGTFGIGEPADIQPIRIYSDGSSIYLNATSPSVGQAQVTVCNLLGQELATRTVDLSGIVTLNGIAHQGVCVVKVQSGKTIVTGKVFIR